MCWGGECNVRIFSLVLELKGKLLKTEQRCRECLGGNLMVKRGKTSRSRESPLLRQSGEMYYEFQTLVRWSCGPESLGKFGVHAQSCLNLWNPMDCSPPGSSVHGIFQARILGWAAISYSKETSWPKNQTRVFCVSSIVRQILYHWATWEAQVEEETIKIRPDRDC